MLYKAFKVNNYICAVVDFEYLCDRVQELEIYFYMELH